MVFSERLGQLLRVPVTRLEFTGAQHGVSHATATLADGREVFVKSGPAGGFPAEANSLRWLGSAGGAPVPEVLAVDDEHLVIELLPPGGSSPSAAFEFGTALARTHAAGADSFGAPWPGSIAGLPLDNSPGDSWPAWYAERRLLPFLRRAFDAGVLDPSDVRLVESVIARVDDLSGPPSPPARIHGDLWSGNIFWSGGQGWLIDPAAHGGHRETDLAMLALFGAPHLDDILAGYTSVFPLPGGWRQRVPLHQLHPLLVHACLYGPSYRTPLHQAAHAATRTG